MSQKHWRAITLQSWIPTLTLAFSQGVHHCAYRCIPFCFKRDRDRREFHKTFVSACLSFAYRIDRRPCAFERALARHKVARSNEEALLENAVSLSKFTYLMMRSGLNNTVSLLHFRLAC